MFCIFKIRKCCAQLVCLTCSKNCEFELYRENIVNAISYFLKGINEKISTYINALENPKNSNLFNKTLNIESFYNHNGFNVLETGPFCKHL